MEEFTQTQLQILTAVVKLFLKRPSSNQGLVQTVLQAATAENDNPDIRDRAYVYWRLLSGDLEIAKNIVLSQKPAITTTVTSLSPTLLEQLLGELSTLASVYHRPPESFVGKGRFGADEIQRAAIQEQRQNAAENPIAASVAGGSGTTTGGGGGQQNNIENLLDIDFDGAAPASAEEASRAVSPAIGGPSSAGGGGAGGGNGGGMADMMGLFDMGASSSSSAPAPPPAQQTPFGSGGMNDLMNGFEGLNFSGGSGSGEPLPAAMQLQQAQGGEGQQQQPKKDSDDLLGLL
jgi:AP-1 complex subunit beta-1